MPRCINNKQSWNGHLNIHNLFAFGNLFDKLGLREKGSTDLLGNTTSLAFLNICSTDLVKKGCLTGVDVPQNTAYWTTILSLNIFEILAFVL